MTNVENKMIQLMAQKLGLADDLQLIQKSYELERFLKLKASGSSHISLSDSAQSVICLDLASSCTGISFDTEHAIILSGLKRNSYLNGLRTIEKLLDLTRELTINELSIQLGVTSVTEKATVLLNKYTETRDCDIRHPQNVSMAVYQACRLEKIKIQRSKILPFSHLKLGQWKILEKKWNKWIEEIGVSKINADKFGSLANSLNDHTEKVPSNQSDATQTECDDNEIQEEYETWKKRILQGAYEELKILGNE